MKKNRVKEKRNKEYFVSLAHTRGSVEIIGTISISTLPIGLFLLASIWFLEIDVSVPPLDSYFVRFLILSVAFSINSLLAIFIKPILKVFYRHQIFAGFRMILASINLIILLFLLLYLILVNERYNHHDPKVLWLHWGTFIGLYLVGLVVNSLWLKQQLKYGFSEDRIYGNQLARSSAYRWGSFGTIFSVVMAARLFSDGFSGIIWWGLAILFAYAFSQLTVEYSFLTYLKITSKDYWVKYEEEG